MAVSEEECSSAKRRRSSLPETDYKHYYLSKCVLRGSVVLQVLYAHLRSPFSNDVVFGKETSIEMVVIGEDGNLQSVCDQPVFGIIRDLAVLPWNDKFHARDPQIRGKDLLVALSDNGKLSLLTFCKEMHRFCPVKHVQLSNPGNVSENLPGRMVAVDSSGCFIAAAATASAYEEWLVLFPMSMTRNEIIDERIIYPSEGEGAEGTSRSIHRNSIDGTIWSMCFISQDSRQPSKENNPLLAVILNRRGEPKNRLLLLELNIKARTIFPISHYVDEAGPLAHVVAEVPNSCGFAFLFREGDALLLDCRDPNSPCRVYRTSLNFLSNAKDEQTNKYVCSWSWEPGNKKDPRMIYCIDTGEFFMIEILFDSVDLKVNCSECLYEGLPCKALLWVEGGYLAAAVEMGDGMVLKLEDGRLCHKNPIQNIAPILDMSVVEYHDEKLFKIFACCGVAPGGSLRIIQSGICVGKLHRTPATYHRLTGAWTVRNKVTDPYHSFLVLSFVQQTRILLAGSRFTDVTDSVDFQPDVCTLACGLVSDGLLVQIHQSAVRLCLHTTASHSEGIPKSSPTCPSWSPDKGNISLGAVGHNFIVVSTSNPCLLYILGVRLLSANHHEIYEMRHLGMQYELSCISIPRQKIEQKQSNSSISANNSCISSFLSGADIDKMFVIGTHRPSVEIWCFAPDGKVTEVACGTIPLTNTMGTGISDCVPQDVRLVFVDKCYVLAGLRNGMLLRFERPAESFPSSPLNVVDTALSSANSVNSVTNAFDKRNDLPSKLQLIAIRRIGIAPVFLVPLDDTLDADIIALSDRPWLLHSARHSLSYTSISFQPSTHVTPVCLVECPKGILFVAESSLHLVEMMYSRRPNVQKFNLECTPRKVLYHNESRMLIVLRTELNRGTCFSDICCVDPESGKVLSTFSLELGETGKSMELIRFGSKQVFVVGTSRSSGPAIMPSGEPVGTMARLLVLSLDKSQLRLDCKCTFESEGAIGSICPYLDSYFLVSVGNTFHVCGFRFNNPRRVIRFSNTTTRFTITSLTAESTRIAVSDCRDGILFYSYNEETKKLEQLYCDPSFRLVADCILLDTENVVVSDRKGSIAALYTGYLEDKASPENNLRLTCAYFMGEVAMSFRKGSYSYRLPADDTKVDSLQNTIIASTLLGSIMIFIPLSREDYELLEAVQKRLVDHKLTAPVLGNDHNDFRSRENPVDVRKILDGDMLTQFLELTRMQQETILEPDYSVNRVVQLLDLHLHF